MATAALAARMRRLDELAMEAARELQLDPTPGILSTLGKSSGVLANAE
jgi:hypothetical protein